MRLKSLVRPSFPVTTFTGALVLACLGTYPAQAATAPRETSEMSVVQDLASRLAGGDEEAHRDLERLNAMTDAERKRLGLFLTGENATDYARPDGVTTLSRDGRSIRKLGDAEWVTETSETTTRTADSTRVAKYNVHSSADETFKFAGISLTKTRVWGDYVTGSGKVLKTTGKGSQVLHNYQPLTEISTFDYAPLLSGGKALFRAKISVRRGPAPWLGGSWSTKEGIQYFRANGPGVYAHGWM